MPGRDVPLLTNSSQAKSREHSPHSGEDVPGEFEGLLSNGPRQHHNGHHLARSQKKQMTTNSIADLDLGDYESQVDEEQMSGDIVQFSSLIFVCSEEQRFATLDVIRIGNEQGEVRVGYRTKEKSAKGNRHYREASGEIVIPEGERTAGIEIEILLDSRWNATLEFEVELFEVEGMNCQLGLYLTTARVKRLDMSYFPSDRFQEYIDQGQAGISMINSWFMYSTWILYACSRRKQLRKVVLILLFELLENATLYLFLTVQVFLIDNVINTDVKEEDLPFGLTRKQAAVGVCIAHLVPLALVHATQIYMVYLDFYGDTLTWLRSSIFRKYLNLNAESREAVPPSALILLIERDSDDVCKGLEAGMNGIKTISRIAMLIVFTIRADFETWKMCLAFVLSFSVMARIRAPLRAEIEDTQSDAQAGYIHYLTESMNYFDLIVGCAQRPRVNDGFHDRCRQFQDASRPVDRYATNNDMIVRWVQRVFLAIYILSVLEDVLRDPDDPEYLSTGRFVAILNAIPGISDNCADLFQTVLQCSSSFTPLRSITYCLNLSIEVPQLQTLYELRWKQTSDMLENPKRASVKKDKPAEDELDQVSEFDKLPIFLKDVSFKHPSTDMTLLHEVNLEAEQGTIVRVEGPQASCRATLLRLLGHLSYPTGGEIFFPTHLRIFYVQSTPVIIGESAWHDLTFACSHQPDPKRVVDIARRLRMPNLERLLRREMMEMDIPKQLAEELELETEEESPEEDSQSKMHLGNLPSSEKRKMNLARAFVTNPEIVVFERPLAAFDSVETKKAICDLIVEHRNNRGIEMPMATFEKRRPRTVFYAHNPDCDDPHLDRSYILPDYVWKLVGTGEDGACAPYAVDSLKSF